jgi:hypothetical protein
MRELTEDEKRLLEKYGSIKRLHMILCCGLKNTTTKCLMNMKGRMNYD